MAEHHTGDIWRHSAFNRYNEVARINLVVILPYGALISLIIMYFLEIKLYVICCTMQFFSCNFSIVFGSELPYQYHAQFEISPGHFNSNQLYRELQI